MMQTEVLVKDLSKEYVTQNYPQEAKDFDRIWALMPAELRGREPLVPAEAEMRFWDQLVQSPVVTDIVIGICAAILYDLGKWSGGKLIGLIRDSQKLAAFKRDWSAKVGDLELVASVIDFVYDRVPPVPDADNETA